MLAVAPPVTAVVVRVVELDVYQVEPLLVRIVGARLRFPGRATEAERRGLLAQLLLRRLGRSRGRERVVVVRLLVRNLERAGRRGLLIMLLLVLLLLLLLLLLVLLLWRLLRRRSLRQFSLEKYIENLIPDGSLKINKEES